MMGKSQIFFLEMINTVIDSLSTMYKELVSTIVLISDSAKCTLWHSGSKMPSMYLGGIVL